MSTSPTGPGWIVSIATLNLASVAALRHSFLFFWTSPSIDLLLSGVLLAALFWRRYRISPDAMSAHFRGNSEAYLVALLTLLAFIVRRTGLYFGLPFCYGVDEAAVLSPSLGIVAIGDFNPHFFHYPSFGYYLTSLAVLLGYIRDAVASSWAHFTDMPGYVPYYYARLEVAIISALTVPALYLLGRRVADRRTAALGALLLALSQLSCESARNANFHAMVPLFVVLALWALVEFIENQSPWWLLAAAALTGLAISTMYYAVSLLPVLLVVAIIRARERRIGLTVLAVLVAVLAFLLTTPYAILDVQEFARQFGERLSIATAATGRGMGGPGGATARAYARGYVAAFGFLAAGLFLFNAVLDLSRFDRRRVTLFAFIIVHLAYVGAYPNGYGRYMAPVEPIYLLLVASGFVRVVVWLRGVTPRRLAAPMAAVGLAFLLMAPLRQQWNWFLRSRAPLATAQAHRWIEQNLDPTGLFFREDGTPFLPHGFTRELRLPRFIDRSADSIADESVRYVIISRGLYTRNAENESAYRRRLRQLHTECRAIFEGNDNIANPTIEIYELGAGAGPDSSRPRAE